jgi:hypothetical protein
MIPELETQQTENQDLELAIQNVKKWAKVLEDNPLLDGNFIQAIEFAGGALTVDVNHGLGRQPRGWIITDFTALAGTAIVRDAWDTNTITFTASAACDLDLWVF